MQPIRRAVIDVGTNSVKLLVADVDGQEIRPVSEQSQQTRLGHAFYETHRLQPEAISATATAVAGFAAAAREAQAASIRVIATSAAREALNRDELTSAIEQASGLTVEVISGEQEADLGFQGVTTDPQLAQGARAALGCRRRQRPIRVRARRARAVQSQLPARLSEAAGDHALQRSAQAGRIGRLPRVAKGVPEQGSHAKASGR